jgi:hypothetical protein
MRIYLSLDNRFTSFLKTNTMKTIANIKPNVFICQIFDKKMTIFNTN